MTMWKFQGLIKKEVEFPRMIVDLRFWSSNFQGVWQNFVEYNLLVSVLLVFVQ